MERFLYQDLVNWKNQKDHKPLILEGARQVGKTWLLKQFGKNEFENLEKKVESALFGEIISKNATPGQGG